MIGRLALVATALLSMGLSIGCAPGTVTAADQKAMEAKYNQGGYEQAMIANGRQKELDQQKKIEADRRAASGDR